jgi:hypothetical protein
MGNWEPILWIIGSGIGFFVLLMLGEFLKKIKNLKKIKKNKKGN